MLTLIYDSETNRWNAWGEMGSFSIHCGYTFYLRVSNSLWPVRVEYDTDWYVIVEGMKFHLHPRQKYLAVI